MKRIGLLAFAFAALVVGMLLTASSVAQVGVPVVVDCDCRTPTDGTTVCKTELNRCETQSIENLCTGPLSPAKYRALEFPQDCRSTKNMSVCNKPERNCYFRVTCIWNATSTPPCQEDPDGYDDVWYVAVKPEVGNCPAGATKCAP